MHAQITHSLPPWAIPAVLVANSLSLLLYNVAGMFVTDELGALSRTVFESARTLFVWLVSALPSIGSTSPCQCQHVVCSSCEPDAVAK